PCRAMKRGLPQTSDLRKPSRCRDGGQKGEVVADATVNGVRIAYELHGHGEPIVFVPGTGMVKEALLAGRATALVETGYQGVLMDTGGVGGSDAPPAPYAVADLAPDVAGLIEQLGIGRCRVVGYSLGGFVTEFLAAERPDLVMATRPRARAAESAT